MPITRTIMVDDDGSGTTGTILNNAWKVELYNQIDAAAGGGTIQTWTPADGSGAGLVFGSVTASFVRNGPLVFVELNMVYPATSNGAGAAISGLPYFTTIGPSGFYPVIGISQIYHVPVNQNLIYPFNPTTGLQRTNAEMSGLVVNLTGVYFAA